MGFPVKLSFLQNVMRFAPSPLMPLGATYGYISSGLVMPKGGACYVAAFDNPANTSKAHIVAYIDWFGRAFSCDEPLVQEPLCDPDLVVYTCGGQCRIDGDEQEKRRCHVSSAFGCVSV